MQLLVYVLTYPFLRLLSILPFPVLYLISDFVYFWVYRVFGYRRKVVRANLELIFSKKPKAELRRIECAFYRHMCDMFLEMIKTLGITRKELLRHFTFTNPEFLRQLESKGKSIMLLFPHYASWEWTISVDAYINGKGYAVYQPINNLYFDRLIRRIREKFGVTLIPTKKTRELVSANRKAGKPSVYGILSDQSPMRMKAQYWTPFMGITVPVHVGAEQLCKNYDLPAVYLKVRKIRRGYYEGTFKLLSANPRELPDYALTDAFLREVEASIKEAPEYYFWTHKRWKHRDKVPPGFR